jgi:DNA-binding beta-propeller fold protein YncE
LIGGFAVRASAEDPPKVEPKVLVVNLENPSGLAIQEGTGEVFVASRYGVYRYKPAEKDRAKKCLLEIINSAEETDKYGKGPVYPIGPLGLAFMNADHLVVGDGSRKDGDEFVRVYKIDAKSAEPWQKEDQAVYTLGPIAAGDQSVKGEGNFYGVAVGAGAIFVTCNGDDTKGWVAKSTITDGKPGDLVPTIATKVATEVDAPVPVTFTLDGSELVVGQMGEINKPGDSLLTFYDPATGELKRKLETKLNDIAGLAYSPKTKKLYATDFSWLDSTKGGLFELEIKEDVVEARKILDLDKPAAIAFDKDGKLYVTVFGTSKEGDDPEKSPGTLQVIEAGL